MDLMAVMIICVVVVVVVFVVVWCCVSLFLGQSVATAFRGGGGQVRVVQAHPALPPLFHRGRAGEDRRA